MPYGAYPGSGPATQHYNPPSAGQVQLPTQIPAHYQSMPGQSAGVYTVPAYGSTGAAAMPPQAYQQHYAAQS